MRRSVSELLAEHDHPLDTEIQAIRAIIKSVDDPDQLRSGSGTPRRSASMATWRRSNSSSRIACIVFHDGAILNDQDGFLEGTYPDRCMAYFHDMSDVMAKGPKLRRAVEEWVRLKDEAG